jgi:hypothetical protein
MDREAMEDEEEEEEEEEEWALNCVRIVAIRHSAQDRQPFKHYLLSYLLHGAEFFLRS